MVLSTTIDPQEGADEEYMGDISDLPSPAQNPSSSPFCVSSGSTDAFHSSISTSLPPSHDRALQKLISDLESLILPPESHSENTFTDAVIYVSGRAVPVHRCILAARSPFFKTLFSKDGPELSSVAPPSSDGCKERNDLTALVKIDLQRLLNKAQKSCRVGYDAFANTVRFLYTGKQMVPVIKCIDDQCLHEACRPVLEFAVEMLSLGSVFDIEEQKALWQYYLNNMMEKAHVDEVLPVLAAAEAHGDASLQSLSKHVVAVSNMDTVDLEKQLPLPLAQELLSLRCKLGLLQAETLNPMHERECQRIRKALDSDDVELVQLLLKEGRVSLDGAHALHYAASYCDPHIVQDILELGLADPNLRNNRGFTVLHVAAMRREPAILVSLLSKGANPLDVTPDGRTALQLCSRLISSHYQGNKDAGEEVQKDRLSVEILAQAGRSVSFTNSIFLPVVDEKELFMRLLYLENRVAVARLLFPQQAKLVTGISHLEATSEFTGLRGYDVANCSRKDASVDLNRTPLNQFSLKQLPAIGSSISTPIMSEALVKRVEALQKTVELGQQTFPRCTAIINSFLIDDLSDLSCIEMGSPEEQKTKKRRYNELKDVLAEAFRKDVAAMDWPKSDKFDLQSTSSSSSPKHK